MKLHKITGVKQNKSLMKKFLPYAAYLNIDDVIKIIREKDQPKKELIKQFSIDEEQAEGILNLKLRNLARLEEGKISVEKDSLKKEQFNIEEITLKFENIFKKVLDSKNE